MKIISIDPDLHYNGVAVYENGQFTNIEKLLLYDLLHVILTEQESTVFFLEYPANTNTYHAGGKGAAINVGKNQAVAIIIEEHLRFWNKSYKLFAPRGYSKIFEDSGFFKKKTGWQKSTNKDMRAAAAIIYTNTMV